MRFACLQMLKRYVSSAAGNISFTRETIGPFRSANPSIPRYISHAFREVLDLGFRLET